MKCFQEYQNFQICQLLKPLIPPKIHKIKQLFKLIKEGMIVLILEICYLEDKNQNHQQQLVELQMNFNSRINHSNLKTNK